MEKRMVRGTDVTSKATHGTNSVIKTMLNIKFIEVTDTKAQPC